MAIIGIYKIETLHNNKLYIGSSDNIEKRIKTHLSRLKRDIHHSEYLQNAYNKYGKDNLKFSVIEILETSENKIVREQYWMDYYKSYDRNFGYNMSKIADSNTTGQKEIYQYDLDGTFIKSWESIAKAAKELEVSETCIYGSLKYSTRSCSGYKWSYNKIDKTKNILKIYACYDLTGTIVQSFKNAKEAARFVNSERNANIIRACRTKGKYKGYYWVKYNSYVIPNKISRPTLKIG